MLLLRDFLPFLLEDGDGAPVFTKTESPSAIFSLFGSTDIVKNNSAVQKRAIVAFPVVLVYLRVGDARG